MIIKIAPTNSDTYSGGATSATNPITNAPGITTTNRVYSKPLTNPGNSIAPRISISNATTATTISLLCYKHVL